jgi:chemotaxis protein CheX
VSAVALKTDPTAEQLLEQELVDAFRTGTQVTMEVQAQVKVTAGVPYVKTAQNKVVHDIAATMGLMSKSLTGAVALGFKEEIFLKIMSKMLGETFDGITTEVEDGCGELLNIIFGQAKKILNEKGHTFGKTLPSIFIGPSLRVRQLTPSPTIILPFESSEGLFHVEIGYRHVASGIAVNK